MEIDGTFVGVVIAAVTCIGGIIARDRYISANIAVGDKAVRDELNRNIDTCHERINKTRDEFVRRDDLDAHMTRIEKTMTGMHEEFKGTNQRIDNFMTAVLNGKTEK